MFGGKRLEKNPDSEEPIICFETFKEHCTGGEDIVSVARGEEVG